MIPRIPVAHLAALLLLPIGLVACNTASEDAAIHAAIHIDDSLSELELADQLPPTVRFGDRMGVAQIAQLPTELDVGPGAERLRFYRAGDVAYWAAERSLVVFTSDGAGVGEGEVIRIGHMGDGLRDLAACVRSCTVGLQVEEAGPA